MIRALDSLGREVVLPRPPSRIVSLVPSITETLFELGLGPEIVGVTDYCVHPQSGVRAKARVGGTKNPRLDAIVALEPDLVIANREENRRRDVERLEARRLQVFVTDARDVEMAASEIEAYGGLAGCASGAQALAARLRDALASARRAVSSASECTPSPCVAIARRE